MDIATIVGIISAFGIVVVAILMGGLGLFIDIPSFLIVVGGTLGATMIQYPFDKTKSGFGTTASVSG